ncbi:MAG TPA: pyridoxal phosphate-dependent aminotransferase family protein, partial [Spirochaetota bacterium]|nr:pyridoxal phosphate-dependent aminotransferase family protein [Spirochaetota bacterium]
MNEIWFNFIKNDLDTKKSKDLYRILPIVTENRGRLIKIENKQLINFASNNYLDLANDKRIVINGEKLAEEFGAGSGASRLISGTIKPVSNLEERFALFSKKEASLIFNSGYNANVGVISALSDKNTVVFCDKLNHASIYDGIFLSSATLERYPHKDIELLRKLVIKHKDKSKKIIVTDTIFSMEGSIAPLKEISEVAKENNCLLIVDEAHSVGLFGDNYSGITTQLGLNNSVDVIIGTLGKGFGVFGSYVASNSILR